MRCLEPSGSCPVVPRSLTDRVAAAWAAGPLAGPRHAGAPGQAGTTDTINFAIPGGGVQTIRPGSPLPMVTHPVFINGYSQAGASPNTQAAGEDARLMVEIDGSLVASPSTDLLSIAADG